MCESQGEQCKGEEREGHHNQTWRRRNSFVRSATAIWITWNIRNGDLEQWDHLRCGSCFEYFEYANEPSDCAECPWRSYERVAALAVARREASRGCGD
jgi:hypothetical protein